MWRLLHGNEARKPGMLFRQDKQTSEKVIFETAADEEARLRKMLAVT